MSIDGQAITVQDRDILRCRPAKSHGIEGVRATYAGRHWNVGRCNLLYPRMIADSLTGCARSVDLLNYIVSC